MNRLQLPRATLVVGIASTLGALAGPAAQASTATALAQTSPLLMTATLSAAPVQNCDDSTAPGTLRSSLVTAATGDVIDLSGLSCTGIKLAHNQGALQVTASDITIKGRPGNALFSISGYYSKSRIFKQTVAGTLKLEYIAVGKGLSNDTGGGCVYSAGNVELFHSQVYNCTVTPLRNSPGNDSVAGGAIFARGSVTLTSSSISDAAILNSYGGARGGAIAAMESVVLQADPNIPGSGSTIANSTATGAASILVSSTAGAIFSDRVFIKDSTIFQCSALSVGAVYATSELRIQNSTVSGNKATAGASALYGTGGAYAIGQINIASSTFAYNVGNKYGALRSGPRTTSLIFSSIFAYSTKPSGQAVADIGQNLTYPGAFSGDRNLIANPPAGLTSTISGSALLTPLGDHGGLTLVHSLRPGSAALRAGVNVTNFQFDQRGQPRGTQPNIDIGSVQVTDIIFANDFEIPP